jgi:hypothetical protein
VGGAECAPSSPPQSSATSSSFFVAVRRRRRSPVSAFQHDVDTAEGDTQTRAFALVRAIKNRLVYPTVPASSR